MSIQSDVVITREEAERLVKKQLIREYTEIVDRAVATMEDWELTSKLHDDLYFYEIECNDDEGE